MGQPAAPNHKSKTKESEILVNYNPTPQAEYLKKTVQVADHHVLVENPVLREAIATALAQYERKLSGMQVNDLGSGCMLFMKVQGAHEFLETFYNLCETTASAAVTDQFNLSGNQRTNAKKG